MASIAKFDEWQYTNGNKVNTVIQVVNTFVTERTTWGFSYSSPTIITPMSVSITPKFSNSKIVVLWQCSFEVDNNTVFKVYKNGSVATNGTNTGDSNYWTGYVCQPHDSDNNSTMSIVPIHYVDNNVGTTAQTTYQLAAIQSGGGSATLYLNRTVGSTGQANYEIATSNAIIMEIAQ